MRLFTNANIATAGGAFALIAIGTAAVLAQEEAPAISAASATHIAMLSGETQVPPVNTLGAGMALIVFDPQTNILSWTIEYADLTGPAIGAHIHGPAAAGENADVIIDLGASGLESPIQGTAEITAEQAAEMGEGLWYVNVHTDANPGGEIRGQVETNM
jgi:hypothetical protein